MQLLFLDRERTHLGLVAISAWMHNFIDISTLWRLGTNGSKSGGCEEMIVSAWAASKYEPNRSTHFLNRDYYVQIRLWPGYFP